MPSPSTECTSGMSAMIGSFWGHFFSHFPHCFVQPLALAESRQFDELYALAHNPVLGENEDEA